MYLTLKYTWRKISVSSIVRDTKSRNPCNRHAWQGISSDVFVQLKSPWASVTLERSEFVVAKINVAQVMGDASCFVGGPHASITHMGYLNYQATRFCLNFGSRKYSNVSRRWTVNSVPDLLWTVIADFILRLMHRRNRPFFWVIASVMDVTWGTQSYPSRSCPPKGMSIFIQFHSIIFHHA